MKVYEKTGEYTGKPLYSCDCCYWWSTRKKAVEMFYKQQGVEPPCCDSYELAEIREEMNHERQD